MSGAADQIDLDRLLFEVCRGEKPRKLFVFAWAKITECEDRFYIEEIAWTDIALGKFDDEASLKENLQEIDPKSYEVTQPGCYLMRGLFDIKTDSDDYKRWDYLEENIIEFDFMCTIEEHERPETSFDSIEKLGLCDLFT
jgi:hypothetical protein